MKNLYEVIRRPLITEKTTTLKETAAHRSASRCTATPPSPRSRRRSRRSSASRWPTCACANVHGKVKRQGRYAGQRPDWKKAYVVLKKGEKMIEFFDQA